MPEDERVRDEVPTARSGFIGARFKSGAIVRRSRITNNDIPVRIREPSLVGKATGKQVVHGSHTSRFTPARWVSTPGCGFDPAAEAPSRTARTGKKEKSFQVRTNCLRKKIVYVQQPMSISDAFVAFASPASLSAACSQDLSGVQNQQVLPAI